jgi:hypothetical protein
MAWRRKVRSTSRGLVKHGGKVITAAHAASCVAKGFKGCSKAETKAVLEVIRRMGQAALRRRS